MTSAPHPTLTQWLVDGSDPSAGYCRICARFAVPQYDGWWHVGVCGQACFEEFKWRETLRTMRHSYRRPTPPRDTEPF